MVNINYDNEIMIVEETKSKRVCPDGTYNAVCAAVYDLGMQKGSNGWPERRKLAFIFEVQEHITDGPLAGQPYRVSKIVSASLSDKSTLTAMLTSWFGHDPRTKGSGRTAFSPSSLVGKPCMLTVAHKVNQDGDAQPFISTIALLMRGLPVLTSTFDPRNVPEWVIKMQGQRLDRLDKPQAQATQADQTEQDAEKPNVPEQPVQVEIPPPIVEDNSNSQGEIAEWI